LRRKRVADSERSSALHGGKTEGEKGAQEKTESKGAGGARGDATKEAGKKKIGQGLESAK